MPRGTEREPFLRYDADRLWAAMKQAQGCMVGTTQADPNTIYAVQTVRNLSMFGQASDPAATPDTVDSAVTRDSGV